MPLGNKSATSRRFLSIAHGKINLRNRDGHTEEFTYIEGLFKGIVRRQREINGAMTNVVDFLFDDGDDRYAVSLIADSGVARGLIQSLAGIKDFSKPVRVETYLRVNNGKEYTNTAVYVGGEKARWAFELPAPEMKTTSDGESFLSYKKRNEVIESAIDEINALAESDPAPAPAEAEDDLPPDGGDPGYGGFNSVDDVLGDGVVSY